MRESELSLRDLQRILGIITSHVTWATRAKRVKGKKASERDLTSLLALWEKLGHIVKRETQADQEERAEVARIRQDIA